MSAEILHGDCVEVLPTLAPASVHAVVTSPPYAEQRKKQYGGIPEREYPAWTVAWMAALRPALAPGASVLVNIREHVKDGQISDYVHRTRLAVRDAGWAEIDELLWLKTDAPPVGRVDRPRRSWERVLWFAPSADVRCYPKANGRTSERIGGIEGKASMSWAAGQNPLAAGVSRSPDFVRVAMKQGVNSWVGGAAHPAKYPEELAAWLLRLVTEPGDTVCDPFAGSGTTGVAALQEGRRFVGIERDAGYCDLARRRIAEAQPSLPLEAA